MKTWVKVINLSLFSTENSNANEVRTKEPKRLYRTPRAHQAWFRKKIREDLRLDSESDHVKYKAARKTLQSRSLWFLLAEKNHKLRVSAQRNPKSWVSLWRVQPRLGNLLAGMTQDWGFLLAETIQSLILFWTGLEWRNFLGSWTLST